MDEPRLTNKQKRKFQTNKQRWEARKTNNKAKRHAARVAAKTK